MGGADSFLWLPPSVLQAPPQSPSPRGKVPRQRRKGETEVHAPHLLPLVDMLPYNRKDLIKGVTNLLVGKPNDANAMGFEELLPLSIVGRSEGIVVYAAVNLNSQLFLHAEKVDDIRPNTVLPTKLFPANLPPAQSGPHTLLRRGHVSPQRFTVVPYRRVIVQWVVAPSHLFRSYLTCT